MIAEVNGVQSGERTCASRVLRYLVSDEWLNIGVLVYDPQTSERRLRLIEEPEEYARVRRLHPQSDVEKLAETLSNIVQLAPQNGRPPKTWIRSDGAQVLKQAALGALAKRRARGGIYVSRRSSEARLAMPEWTPCPSRDLRCGRRRCGRRYSNQC